MWKTIVLWFLALLLTVGSAVYQRMTGPTYPLNIKVKAGTESLKFQLLRSHSTSSDYIVTILSTDTLLKGELFWKRYKTKDDWTFQKLIHNGKELKGNLPAQPPAGKLEYYLKLFYEGNEIVVNKNEPVIIRYKGDVPDSILIPHIIFMFAAMFVASRAGFEAIFRRKNIKNLAYWTTALLFLGGFVFGPLVQQYAFGALWTGFPFGYDLTDNKTLIALLFWLIALYALYKEKKERLWVIVASVVMFIVFLIPHSLLGSELDYDKLDKEQQQKIEMENN